MNRDKYWCPNKCGKCMTSFKFGLYKCSRCNAYAMKKGTKNSEGYEVVSNIFATKLIKSKHTAMTKIPKHNGTKGAKLNLVGFNSRHWCPNSCGKSVVLDSLVPNTGTKFHIYKCFRCKGLFLKDKTRSHGIPVTFKEYTVSKRKNI